MRLPIVCSRHVLANADADSLYPITFIPVSLFLVYAVADCVLPTCPGLKRLPILCIRRPFFPVYDVFFRLFLHVLVLPYSSSLCKISFGGSATCGLFYKHALAFVPFSFYHPLHVGE